MNLDYNFINCKYLDAILSHSSHTQFVVVGNPGAVLNDYTNLAITLHLLKLTRKNDKIRRRKVTLRQEALLQWRPHQFVANNVVRGCFINIYARVSDLIDKVTRHDQA
ncbi:hypothetical protein H5410_050564 [Solanum commersonii]|uniref:Uncharacterized protein n=1 Tax=Solanum commersonii TaxID=4109 RepID=A0A9J5WVT4_SOLCO|nr:hypothetical protein H5410_050564 [Solanum commersonii]